MPETETIIGWMTRESTTTDPDENSEYIKRIASEKLAQIDEYVSDYVLSISRK